MLPVHDAICFQRVMSPILFVDAIEAWRSGLKAELQALCGWAPQGCKCNRRVFPHIVTGATGQNRASIDFKPSWTGLIGGSTCSGIRVAK